MCVAGARWVQSDILDVHPEAPVKVYAVSYEMLGGDRFAKWLVDPSDDLISDARALHFWDDDKAIGRYYEDKVTRLGQPGEERIEWDAYFLYGPDTTWSNDPPEPISWGRTIVDTREQFREDFETLMRELSSMSDGAR